MNGQMCWLAGLGGGNKILHLREHANRPWQPYSAFPHYRVPDLTVPGATKGWTTYQQLRQLGWTLIPTAQAHAIAPTQAASAIVERQGSLNI